MEKKGALKERRAREIIKEIISSSKSEAEANRRLLESNGFNDENSLNRANRLLESERVPKCQFLEDYFREQSTYAYINSQFDKRPALLNNIHANLPNRLNRKEEQVNILNNSSNTFHALINKNSRLTSSMS